MSNMNLRQIAAEARRCYESVFYEPDPLRDVKGVGINSALSYLRTQPWRSVQYEPLPPGGTKATMVGEGGTLIVEWDWSTGWFRVTVQEEPTTRKNPINENEGEVAAHESHSNT